METPWKVIAAFLGVFAAGAIFGGFFSIGIGARWMATPPAAVSPPTAAPVSPAPVVANPPAAATPPASASAAPSRASLLQVPLTWQAPQLMRRYAERLGLTAEQKERITPLIHRAIEDYRRVQQSTFRDTGIILQRLQEDIAKELTPEQQNKLREMEQRQREMLQKLEQRQRKAIAPRPKSAPEHTPESGAGSSAQAPNPSPGATAEAVATPSTTAIH